MQLCHIHILHWTKEFFYMIILKKGKSIREIAEYMNRSPSTISRELRRNRGNRGYRASKDDKIARERRSNPRVRT